MTEGLRQAGRETGVDPALIEAWCELGYVVTEDNRRLFSAGDILAWEAAVRRHVDNFGDESDLDGENRLDEDEIHDGEFTAYGEAWCTTLRRRQLNVPEQRRGSG
jgi:hypothetical protein